MSGQFKKRGGGGRFGNQKGKQRGGAPLRGSSHGGISKGGNRGGGGQGGFHRGRGLFSAGGGRGGRGNWRGGRGVNNGARRNASADGNNAASERRGGKNADLGKKKKKFNKAFSMPSTPAVATDKNNIVEAVKNEDDEEMSVSDMEVEETIAKAPTNKGTSVAPKHQEKKMPSSVKGAKSMQFGSGKKQQSNKKDRAGSEIVGDNNGVAVTKKVKKTHMVKNESSEEDDDDESIDEDEEEESDEDDEESMEPTFDKTANGSGETDDFDEDEEEDEESMEDEDETETLAKEKKGNVSTPSKTAPLKSALKTPGTGKSVDKHVLLSPSTLGSPEMLAKKKTPVTPHPKKAIDRSRTPTSRRLKFEESEESNGGDGEDGKEDEDDEDMESDNGEELNKLSVSGRKVKGTGFMGDENVKKISGGGNESKKKFDKVSAKTQVKVQMKQKVADEFGKKQKGKGGEKKTSADTAPGDGTRKGIKRKLELGPILKPEDAEDLISEEQKRREERDKKSLFVRGLPKDVKLAQLKDLHNDIVYVRHLPHRNFAWLFFASEELCEKAYEDISKQTVEGKKITVDFCGAKSKTRPQKQSNQLPINPLELFVGGLPPSTSKDQLKVIFREAIEISFPKQAKTKNKLYCFVKFRTEKDARAAFETGKALKIDDAPVDVLYARVRKGFMGDVKSQNTSIVSESDSVKKVVKEVGDGDKTLSIKEVGSEVIEKNEAIVPQPKKLRLMEAVDRKIKDDFDKNEDSEALKGSVVSKVGQSKLNGSDGDTKTKQKKRGLGDVRDEEKEDEEEDEDEEEEIDVEDDDEDEDDEGEGEGDGEEEEEEEEEDGDDTEDEMDESG